MTHTCPTIFADRYDLFSGARVNIRFNEHGLPLAKEDLPGGNSAFLDVWTGTRNNGAAGQSCNDFTAANQPGDPIGPGFVFAILGDPDGARSFTDRDDGGSSGCSAGDFARIHCFELE